MQRPCFALAVLLTSVASSLMFVGRASSQPPGLAATQLPGPVCGFIAGYPRIVLGQSVDAEDVDRWWDESYEACQMASDEGVRAPSSSLAGTEPTVPTVWWETLGTGYDAAYDFAMHDGTWITLPAAAEPTAVEVAVNDAAEEDVAEEVATEDVAAEIIVCHPIARQLDGDDWNYHCLGRDKSEITGVPLCQWSGCDLTAEPEIVSDCNWQPETPALVSVETSAWAIQQGRLAAGWLESQVAAWHATLSDRERLAALWTNLEGLLVSQTAEEIPSLPVVVEGPVAEDFEHEVLLLTTANTLDNIAIRLQETAQQLRSWAADRIVSKHHSRRVARNTK